MSRSRLVALMVISFVAGPASANTTMEPAVPALTPDGSLQRPVSEPDTPPPMGLDFFDATLDGISGHEEAWPWPVNSSDR
jgi:hypothetical protein